MLEIKDLVVSFNGERILNGINLTLDPGESLAIIGESGAGKTTLGLSIMGFVEGRVSGQIYLNGEDLLSLGEEELRSKRGKEMAMVFQNVEDALNPLYDIHSQVMEAIIVHRDGSRAAFFEEAYKVLESVGIGREMANSYPHQLSGGERQRSLIAMALANDPSLLILDEPTASLDSMTKRDILRLLRSYMMGKISLVITHDISAAAQLCRYLAVLYGGMIIEMGLTNMLLRNPRHPYTRGLLRSYPNMTTTKDLQGIPGQMVRETGGCLFHRRCTQAVGICSQEVPDLVAVQDRFIACHRGGIVPLLQIEGLSKSFGQKRILSDVDLTLYEGETLAVVGESGSGKTTLAKTVIGLLPFEAGKMMLDGSEVRKRDLGFYRMVQMVYQNPKESLSHRMNVLELVREPLDVQGIGSLEEKKAMVKGALQHVELPSDEAFLERYPHQLSGGEAQRVAIARAMVLGPKLLIADEPTSALDCSVQAKILRLLMDIQERRGLSIILITHDIALARKVSDRIAVLHHGRIVEEGISSEVVSNPSHPYTGRLVECASMLHRKDAAGLDLKPEIRWLISSAEEAPTIAIPRE